MANNYVETAFNVPVTPEEASLLEECFLVAEKLSPGFSKSSRAAMQALESLCAACSDAFRKTFPKQDQEENPFASFLELWLDPDVPTFDADITIDEERSEEHTSELQSLMRISYAVFCLKKKKHITQ